jgi:hypothetical protein
VNELETRLRDLGAELALPWEPDLVGAVTARLHRPARREWGTWRRPLLAAVALVALAVAIAFAVPPARSAILRFFHLGAVSVERVQTLPPARQRPLVAGFGKPVDRAAAEERVGLKLLLPPLSGGAPKQVYAPGDEFLATVLSVPVDDQRKPVLLIEIPGQELGIAKKVVQKETLLAPVSVKGRSGMWIRGPHVVAFVRTSSNGMHAPITRASGSALIWLHGNLTLRLEGDLTEEQALRLARSIGG